MKRCPFCLRHIETVCMDPVCRSLEEDFDRDFEPGSGFSDMIDHILAETKVRSKMPRYGLKDLPR
jgi:hypothetical protein